MQENTCKRCGTVAVGEPSELEDWEVIRKDLLCPDCVADIRGGDNT